jgi:lactate dehydrogenase-like 2-hydroxyacid dehydrogenase
MSRSETGQRIEPRKRMKKRVIITRRLPETVLERAAAKFDAVLNPDDRQYTPEELRALLQDADAALICLPDRFTRGLIEGLPPRFQIVSTFSVGLDHIDLEAARAKGIRVGNAPHGVTIATAEIAMLLILGATRRAPEGERLIRDGRWANWTPTFMLGRRLDGKVLGIFGLGRIGQALAKRARAFDMAIHYCSRHRLPETEERGAVYHATIESLAAVSDVLSINAPSTPETRHIVNTRLLERLKPGAIVVNTARGDLVDDRALIAALKSGQVGYAGLDVFEGEPSLDPGYLTLDNVFLLPHMGSQTIEARTQMGLEALANIEAHFEGRELPFAVV